MIYNDTKASRDTKHCPARRDGEICVNCNQTWILHQGWYCESIDPCDAVDYDYGQFHVTPSHKRYLTQSMIDSIMNKVVVEKSTKHYHTADQIAYERATKETSQPLNDWRTWQHKVEGECPCGIRRNVCTYHK